MPDTAATRHDKRPEIASAPLPLLSPYFDTARARKDIERIVSGHDLGPSAARPKIVELIKPLVKHARTAARQGLDDTGDGRGCAAGLSAFQDALIELLHDYTVRFIYVQNDPTETEEMAVVATGGYGRGLLAPGSDVDLLFLIPAKKTARTESIIEHILLSLWDLGFKVGHATRTVDQCIKLGLQDMTIRTALLDSRFMFGSARLFAQLDQRFRAEVRNGTGPAFVEAKLAERDQRHKRTGESRFKVEPNIKDGKGGLRDLHTLHWLARYMHDDAPSDTTRDGGIFTQKERKTFKRCEDFLWTVRCHLHFLTNRAEERLSFEMQRPMAERLGYRDRGGLRGVERFMKHYFLVAKDIGDLTTTLCAALELEQVKPTPQSFVDRFNPMAWKLRRRIRQRTEFRVDNGRINAANDGVFERDPVNLIRIFAAAEETGTLFHPQAIRLIRAALHKNQLDEKTRADPEANRIFLELLTGPSNPEPMLRRMNETGVLGKFMPDFGKVVSMMQFNMYHHFTVDEHLVRTVGELARIEAGGEAKDLPLSSEIISQIQSRRALYVAALLHDIGKGRDEDHSILGARIARELCPRLGLEPAETDTIAWLIEQHLTMSTIAQSRDLSDPKTIRTFANIVQTPERLKLLLLLTVADIRAVGPGTWNGWKGQLLRTLYYETEPLVSGGHSQISGKQRAKAAEEAFREAAKVEPGVDANAFVARHYPDYWMRTEPKKQVEHAKFLAKAEKDGKSLATMASTDAFTAITELTVLAPDHPRLLARFAGACAASGANIVGAHISTTRDGMALDTFLLQRDMPMDDDELRRAQRIGELIGKVLSGETKLKPLVAKRAVAVKQQNASFTVVPDVILDNTLSDTHTVIEVAGLDRPGLLSELTHAIADLSLDIASAHITTFGEKAVDVFYVTDLTRKKIAAPQRQKAIRERLQEVLQPTDVAQEAAKS